MDQLSAHLERGWDLAQRGDAQGASSSARRALELDPDSPEVHNLLGFVAALDGDCDEAIEAYLQAIDLDDSYVEAMLNAAELMVHPLGQLQEAINLCEQILDLTDYQDEVIDARLLKFEAMLAMSNLDDAQKALAQLPEGPFENASHNFLAGRAYFELGDREAAQRFIDASLESDPRNPEAHYYAGLLCEERGDARGACAAFLHTRQLELEQGMPPWAPNGETFLMFVEKAIAGLDASLAAFMQDAELYVADVPGAEVVVDGIDPRSMTLMDAALTESEVDSGTLARVPEALVPERVTLRVFLYALNIMRSASGLHAVQQTIHDALETELKATLTELGDELSDTPQPGPDDPAAPAE